VNKTDSLKQFCNWGKKCIRRTDLFCQKHNISLKQRVKLKLLL